MNSSVNSTERCPQHLLQDLKVWADVNRDKAFETHSFISQAKLRDNKRGNAHIM